MQHPRPKVNPFRLLFHMGPDTLSGGAIYAEEELKEIRLAIASSRTLIGPELDSVRAAATGGMCPDRLAPFWKFSSADPGLFEKLSEDQTLKTYSIYGFFPVAHALVYGSGEPPQISFQGRTRGRVAILNTGSGGLVIKPVQSHLEEDIARIAGELEIGPRQYQTIPGFITEELVKGTFFTQLPPQDVQEDRVYRLGGDLVLCCSDSTRTTFSITTALYPIPQGGPTSW